MNEQADRAQRIADRLVDEIRVSMARQRMNNRDLSNRLSELGAPRSEPTVSRLLRGRQQMTVVDLEFIAHALGESSSDLLQRAIRAEDEHGEH